jgi:hypothetical protein
VADETEHIFGFVLPAPAGPVTDADLTFLAPRPSGYGDHSGGIGEARRGRWRPSWSRSPSRLLALRIEASYERSFRSL